MIQKDVPIIFVLSIADLASGTKIYCAKHCEEYFHVTDWPNSARVISYEIVAIVVHSPFL